MNTVKYVGGLIFSVLVIMAIIYGIKKVSAKYNVPVVSTIAEGV